MSDLRETLDQLDRRLAELRHRVTDLTDTPESVPPPPPRDPRPLPLPEPLELQADEPAGPPVEHSFVDSSQGRAVAEGVGRVGSQIEQLVKIRERLLADARELLNRYQRELEELEREDTSDIQEALASLLSPPPAAPLQTPAVDSPEARPAFYEGVVTLLITGASRIQTVQVVADALSRVRHAENVYIRRWHAGRLSLEVSLVDGAELLGELNRVFPFPFAVQSATSREVVINLEGEL